MTIRVDQLKLVLYPAGVLRTKAQPIPAVTPEVQQVATRMIQIMHEAAGVGLAGPQVGLDWRLFVANPTGRTEDDLVFINPVLSQPSRAMDEAEEGCLSLPNINAHIRRPKSIGIDAMDLQGQPFHLTDDSLPARVWQHEYDHLDGILILDRMTAIEKMANRSALRELERAAEDHRSERRKNR